MGIQAETKCLANDKTSTDAGWQSPHSNAIAALVAFVFRKTRFHFPRKALANHRDIGCGNRTMFAPKGKVYQ
jgi:hypothetical protein